MIISFEDDVTHLSINKREVDKLDFTDILRLIEISDEQGKLGFRSLTISFDGYDDDKRMVFEIPEIRKYVSELFERVPHLLFHIDSFNQSDQMLIMCISDIAYVCKGEKMSLSEWLALDEKERPQYQMAMIPPLKKMAEMQKAVLKQSDKVGIAREHMKEMLPLLFCF